VEACQKLERELLFGLDAAPKGQQTFQVKDALSLVALRNRLRICCICVGMD
jgi:hypothetical protein